MLGAVCLLITSLPQESADAVVLRWLLSPHRLRPGVGGAGRWGILGVGTHAGGAGKVPWELTD